MPDGDSLLRIAAFDARDLEIISAQMQDAILTVGDVRYLPRRNKLVLTAKRFDWQAAEEKNRGPYRRRLTGLSFARVLDVKAHNIRQEAGEAVLSLLSVSFEADEAPSGAILLTFSGGGLLRLAVECIEASLEDLGPQWETVPKPAHPLSADGGSPPHKWEGRGKAARTTMANEAALPAQRLVAIDLEGALGAHSADAEHERKVAIYDLLEANRFSVEGNDEGPYRLKLSILDRRLVLDISDRHAARCSLVGLSLSPFRRIVKDYFMICDSYHAAIRSGSPSRIETLDMARRGLHNEGCELLQERLRGKVAVDFDTARRLFTLVCALHWRG